MSVTSEPNAARTDEARLIASLERLAERVGDPAPLVYDRLFTAHPELEPLFVRDVNGAVRGEMLAQAIACLLDLAGPRAYAANLIATERVNHEGLGVPATAFPSLFTCLWETARAAGGPDWDPATEAAWRRILAEALAATGPA